MLNPILYTEKVITDFLKYQLTTYAFADADLYTQMRRLLNLDETRHSPLLRGPYFSLSRSFRKGPKVSDLVAQGALHPHLANLIPFEYVFGHQESAMQAIGAGKTTLISTGTGSGKTECFLYPIISRCLELRDEGAPPGIVAVIVYPMNALAEDQLERLRDLLAGSGIPFGMYIGKTPEYEREVEGKRLPAGSSRADYRAAVRAREEEEADYAIHPSEEVCSRETMRTAGQQPRILLTNVKQLELLLTRQQDVELFEGARLDFLVFDEAHTYRGAAGAETACLVRRLRAFCGKQASETVCVATSATLADPERGPEAALEFATRFFGVAKDDVVLVREEYEPDLWAERRRVPRPLPGDPREHLKNVLDAVEEGDNAWRTVRLAYRGMTGETLPEENWREALYDALAANELVYQIADALKGPRALADLLRDLEERIGRAVPEEELLAWLALGATARKFERPLLRPVVHAFIRGVAGAVVTFPPGEDRPRLWLSAEDAKEEEENLYPLRVLSCNTCGQHYFEHHVKDFEFLGKMPGGGEALGESYMWPALDKERGGRRVVLLDRLITEEGDDEGGEEKGAGPAVPSSCAEVWFCRACGALHPEAVARCGQCGTQSEPVRLLAVRQNEKHPGHLTCCVSCKATGRDRPGIYREPARPVRAITVSDVHVLAQNMIQHAERRRLLVFSDNRQDAAFQAGWMADHARRYRLRAVMHERILKGTVSVGDLAAYLDDVLDADDELSRALVPEVWRVFRKEAEGARHQEDRRLFVRIQVLREITTGVKQRIGLEPWGRMRIAYGGLTEDLPLIREWADRLGVEPQLLADGIAGLLDIYRRNSLLLDREGHIFSRFWEEGDRLIQRGYLPLQPGIPKGLKLRREANDVKERIQQLLSSRGDTLARQAARRWGVPANEVDAFFERLWQLLAGELGLLVSVTLKGSRGRALPGCTGAHQIDADKLRLEPHRGVYRCTKCRRVHLRPTPKNACLAWRCDGTTQFEPESPDDYDLMVIDQQFEMLRPREHSAMVPAADRERFERQFKSEDDRLNTLVCTPTLELGVDIGALDSVLMRNVPPLPSNYWQRAGRAGRRHRMAVNVTYARAASHDRAYFLEPLKLLEGVVSPPRFNLRNEVMVAKHVHAAVLTALHQLARGNGSVSESDRDEVKETLAACFPRQVKDYLFDPSGNVRAAPADVRTLTTLVTKHETYLLDAVRAIFAQGWPVEDGVVVTEERLRGHVCSLGERLAKVIDRIWRRLQWALDQMERLDAIRRRQGTLDQEQDALRRRCDNFVKRLKGVETRRRREAEGYDDIYTFGVLAAEGFLPGYGLDVGSVVAYTHVPPFAGGTDFDLPRASSVALREYVPGNLIYANGNRFVPRYYHLDPRGVRDPVRLRVDVANEAVDEIGGNTDTQAANLGAITVRAVLICDVDMPHQSHISDEEDYRFQMAVSIFGKEQDRHGEGRAYTWGRKEIAFRCGVHLRLVNVGAAWRVRGGELGYPVCLVCGQSRSPLASDRDRETFAAEHQERCSQRVAPTGFYADIVADALMIQACETREEAYSLAEALRIGASQVLDMEVEDLQILTVTQLATQSVNVLLYDPMPGGSGLLEQMLSRWGEVGEAALGIVDRCPGACSTSCVDCLQTFRNAYYHRYLNRHTAATRLKEWGGSIAFSHAIPPKQAVAGAEPLGDPVNQAETLLRDMLNRAGFPAPVHHKEIDLGRPLGTTRPDAFFEVPDRRKEGVCVYLDGLSRHIHGNPETAQRDREIREGLRAEGYEVIEIPTGNLSDREAMRRCFYRIGQVLLGREQATAIRDNTTWFG
jgi:ATP-dependent helicase YprA (DUF1998 family)